MSIGKRFGSTILLIAICCSSGCLVGGSSEVHRDGSYISESTMNTIEPGKTSKAWVLATFGEPTSKQEVEPGHEVWKYSYKETKQSSGYVFLITAGSDKTITGGNVFVEMKDDVVTKSWRG